MSESKRDAVKAIILKRDLSVALVYTSGEITEEHINADEATDQIMALFEPWVPVEEPRPKRPDFTCCHCGMKEKDCLQLELADGSGECCPLCEHTREESP